MYRKVGTGPGAIRSEAGNFAVALGPPEPATFGHVHEERTISKQVVHIHGTVPVVVIYTLRRRFVISDACETEPAVLDDPVPHAALPKGIQPYHPCANIPGTFLHPALQYIIQNELYNYYRYR